MLAIFHNGFAHFKKQSKNLEEILRDFHSSNSNSSFCITFNNGAAIALSSSSHCSLLFHRRLFACLDDIYCMFVGSLSNLSSLIKQYGLCGKSTDESTLVIEMYRTLRDGGLYPADQVLKDFNGSFGFVVYDNKNGSVFAALSSDGGITMYWGMAADSSVTICDDLNVMKNSCGKSFAPFPNGCVFHSEGGLRSFERPMNKMKAMPRIDSKGIMCGAFFKVDSYTKISSIPRVGSSADWTSWEDSH